MRSSITLLFLAVCLSSSCHYGRMITRGTADITDHKVFPSTPIPADGSPFRFSQSEIGILDTLQVPSGEEGMTVSLDDYLANSRTTGFLVIQNDSILFERYYRGYADSSIANIFSASKSITSLMVGIALDDGFIKSIEDPVTDYLPELAEKGKHWKDLKIRHLLNMRSGIKFKEAYTSPFAEVARLYYGRSQFKQISKMDFEHKPGEVHNYQSVSTSLLSMVVERASGMEMGSYLHEKVWKPMGMEFDASWSLDDKKHRSTKGFCCLNTTARDLAKIGKLYLQRGTWDGKQIVSSDWVHSSITPNLDNDCYQYQWYNPHRRGSRKKEGGYFTDSLSAYNRAVEAGLKHFQIIPDPQDSSRWAVDYCIETFYALGIRGQYLYVNPRHNIIIVRIGERFDRNYERLFREIMGILIEQKEK